MNTLSSARAGRPAPAAKHSRPAGGVTAASLQTIATPALVVDLGRLDGNLRRMAAAVRERDVALRPHVKTVKSRDILARVQELGINGVTVSTLKEADYFFAHGFRDLFYAVAIGPGKLARAAALVREGARLLLAADSAAAAKAIADAGRRFDITFEVLLEVDCGGGRCGLEPDSRELVAAAELLDGNGGKLAGVFTYAGYACAGIAPGDFRAIANAEAGAAVHAAQRLRAAGHECAIVSVGSSATSYFAVGIPGVTEIRCGVYMFGDLFQDAIGACRRDDIALSVLTEVISHQRERNFIIVDAGALALSKDRSTLALGAAADCGYGLVMDIAGRRVHPDMQVARVWQEHGLITSTQPIEFDRFPIGSRLRILPNHSCLTAAAHERYHVVRNGVDVLDEWTRINGW